MRAELKYEKKQFSRILDGERDNDFHRNLAGAISAGIKSCVEKALPVEWLKSLSSGREEFCIWEGRLGSPNFYLANLHKTGGLFASDFRMQVDVPKGTTSPITDIATSGGVDFTCDMSRFDGRVLRPKVLFKEMFRWDRHILQFYSIRIPSSLLPWSLEMCEQCTCPVERLRPTSIAGSWLFPDWLCICCGTRYLCECSRGCLEFACGRDGYDNHHYIELSQQVKYREGVCHLCRGMPSETKFGSEMNGGPIYQLYLPYLVQESTLNNVDLREAENLVRDRLGVPRIGEGWLNEMLVVNTVRYLFPKATVVHQASPPWLGRQRYDAYIDEYRVAIEYHGEQHYNALEVFGGELGLQGTQERDQRKLNVSAENGVEVVIISFDEILSEELIYQRVKDAIDRQTENQGKTKEV